MSITVTTDVFCDQCNAWIDGVTGPRPDSRSARAKAQSYGWGRRNGKDLCPECLEAGAGFGTTKGSPSGLQRET